MPSPDVTPYVDLRVYDKDPQDIFDAAKLALQTSLPEWVPREGNIEVLLLEALALEVAESAFTVNRLPSGVVEVLLRLFGIERDNGAAPVVDLEFTMVGTTGYTVPAGVQARLEIPGGLEPVIFTTSAELTIAPGNSTGVVSAVGDRFTDDANNIVLGTALEFMDSVVYVEGVTLDAVTTGGREPEEDTDYFTRALTRFTRLSDTLVLPSHFTSFALEDTDFYRAFTIDNWNGSTGSPGDHPGHVTVAVYGNGALATTQQKNDLEAAIEARILANLDAHVIDPTINTVAVTATVKAKAGYLTSSVQSSILQALNNYLDPMTWEWGTVVRRNELITLISNVEGVDYVDTMTTPASDLSLTGNAPLADAGTLTITVT